MPFRRAIMATLISPMIVPADHLCHRYVLLLLHHGQLDGQFGLSKNFVGYVKVILAHAALGTPFVIITVTATLVGFDKSLVRAAANLGADPVTTFFRVQMRSSCRAWFPVRCSPSSPHSMRFGGGAVCCLGQQKTLPWQMFTGLRDRFHRHIVGRLYHGGDIDCLADYAGIVASPLGRLRA